MNVVRMIGVSAGAAGPAAAAHASRKRAKFRSSASIDSIGEAK